jgi:hypothetical protein
MESLESYPGGRLEHDRKGVAEALDCVSALHGLLASIIVDNGTEFTSHALNEWVYRRHRPTRPTHPRKKFVLTSEVAPILN